MEHVRRLDQRGMVRPEPRTPNAVFGHQSQPVQVPQLADSASDPVRNVAFYSGLAWLFLVFGTIPELLAYVLHTNTYLLYVFAPPAMIGLVVSGAIPRTWRGNAAKYWMAFVVWMILATILSTWVGGSVGRLLDYLRYSLPLMFVTGGLILSWRQVRSVFYAIAAAGLINLFSARLFASEDSGRISLDSSGTIGNSNDLAAHLTMVLPFLLFIVLDRKRWIGIRVCLALAIGYGAWVILGTGSRGGLIAIAVAFLTILLYASAAQRVAMLVVGLVMAATLPVLLPATTVGRLGTLFTGKDEEAMGSQESRSYLLRQSIIYTAQHPLAGVGPDQFGNFEGKMSINSGVRGVWHATHCAFTQVSSECGVPALIFFVLGIGSALRVVHSTLRRARREGFEEIFKACLCYLTAMAGFMSAITFLANAYRFYLPAMIGLAIAMGTTATRFMDSNSPAGKQPALPQRF